MNYVCVFYVCLWGQSEVFVKLFVLFSHESANLFLYFYLSLYNSFFTQNFCKPSGTARVTMGPMFRFLPPTTINKLIQRLICIIVYKSLDDIAPEKLGNIFVKLFNIHTRVLPSTKFYLPTQKMRTAYGKKSFAFRGTNAWNIRLRNGIGLYDSFMKSKRNSKL